VIIVMKSNAEQHQVDGVVERLEELGLVKGGVNA
jgi:hypothetical protein